ncbi:Uncharacterised protein [Mycobacteroides abscessus subsp. abscessus]|nr:Uncharacterised protein [Mycobacteroides abscessus subsp. abscessus]
MEEHVQVAAWGILDAELLECRYLSLVELGLVGGDGQRSIGGGNHLRGVDSLNLVGHAISFVEMDWGSVLGFGTSETPYLFG